MALPKKGRKELTVDGSLYHYLVKARYARYYDGEPHHPWATVLEVETGRKFTMELHRRDEFEEGHPAIQPSDVTVLIRYWNEHGFEEGADVKPELQLRTDRIWRCTDLSPKKVKK